MGSSEDDLIPKNDCNPTTKQQQQQQASSSSSSLENNLNNPLFPLGYKERVVAKTVVTKNNEQQQVNNNDNNNNDDDTANLDWILTNYDQQNSEPQTLEEELQRLQALRSYLILDSEREYQFERLTALAGRILNVPIALVSLVDLGRQWFMSNRGLGDVRETPRSQAFCSHAIVSKDDILIIPDAKTDPRFANNPLVTGPPFIRFYAGAPLETPEGYKFGTFCIIDTEPWPDGLDLESKQNLREFAGLAVEVLVARRKKREREQEKNTQLIACTAHDLLTPLSGIELSLHLLKEDENFQCELSEHYKREMQRVQVCTDIVQEICKSVRTTYADTKSSFELSLTKAQLERIIVDSLIEKLYTVVESIKKQVSVTIIVDEDVPKEIISDPSKILRGAINLLAVACERTKEGTIVLRFSIRKDSDEGDKSSLLVTCEDTAPAVDLDMYKYLFNPVPHKTTLFEDTKNNGTADTISPELSLFSVACEMNVIGGEYGFRPRIQDENGCKPYDRSIGNVTGSIFWFCIPCTSLKDTNDDNERYDKIRESSATRLEVAKFHRNLSGEVDFAKFERKKRALVIEDSTVVRKMLTKILTMLNFDVSQAENGMQGLEILKSALFDLTLCDFLMPVMDGLDCVQQYRDWERYHRPWIEQRIIGISAHATLGDVEKGLKSGMDAYKDKPITFKVLSELIDSDAQKKMSIQLDDIERREALIRSAENDVLINGKNKRAKITRHVDTNMRSRTCLVLTPRREEVHLELMQDVIRTSGWQSTSAANEAEAMTFLKMRMWDLILVDDAFVSTIVAFREWESQKRRNVQKFVVLMSENVDATMAVQTQPPKGFDILSSRPMCLHALKKLLHRASFHVANGLKNMGI